jgi:hypothetical protein
MTSSCEALRSPIDEAISLLSPSVLINIPFSNSSAIRTSLLYLEPYRSAASHVYEIPIGEIEWLFDSGKAMHIFLDLMRLR